MELRATVKIGLGAAAITLAAFAWSSEARAGAAASSILEVTNLRFLFDGTLTQITPGAFSSLDGTNNGAVSAQLDSVAGGAALTDSETDPILSADFGAIDLARVCRGDCGVGPGNAPAEGDFATAGLVFPPGGHFSSADMQLSGSILDLSGITGGIPDPGPSGGANASGRADVALEAQDGGQSSSEVGNSTDFIFTATQTGGIDVAFDWEAGILLGLNPDAGPGSNVFASIQWSLTIAETNNPAAVLLDIDQDTFLGFLNSISLSAPGVAFVLADSGSENFSTTADLVAGTSYTLTIDHQNRAVATKVPEPASLALFGIGLLGLGAMVSRRRKTRRA